MYKVTIEGILPDQHGRSEHARVWTLHARKMAIHARAIQQRLNTRDKYARDQRGLSLTLDHTRLVDRTSLSVLKHL